MACLGVVLLTMFTPYACKLLFNEVIPSGDASQITPIAVLLFSAAAGFVMVDYIDRPESPYNLARRFYHVAEFGVDPAWRRRGVASALVASMKADARARGFHKIELDAWAFNKGALAFYEAMGFETYRRFMELPLSDE